ncbi:MULTISPECIES: LysM peptidoglycan-binding domain-containing protein [Arthrobacter]|uniref:LysM peptidoglycan-binding domain-containing protein n=2 Tax=Arthrobacter TaxID=1663 RepID=A0ABU9KM64_9MICC|nr:LysM peptidoglycan-binding domain-containing protein [Arthrobacter sp. YJM1]MDP5227865.1 LysM peptidoglycan-binding domain-containing protein [Arthrobacter sp. YJM1]
MSAQLLAVPSLPIERRVTRPAPAMRHASVARTVPDGPRMRLTRRGRFVFFGLPTAILLAALLTVGAGALLNPVRATDAHTRGASTVSVVVRPGETLWGIAQRVAPERDPREVVGEIARLNGLKASQLMAGQELFLPAN